MGVHGLQGVVIGILYRHSINFLILFTMVMQLAALPLVPFLSRGVRRQSTR
jgi:hypothetical protein